MAKAIIEILNRFHTFMDVEITIFHTFSFLIHVWKTSTLRLELKDSPVTQYLILYYHIHL